MAKEFDLLDFTREGLVKFEKEFKSENKQSSNNPFTLRWQDKIKKKLINTSTPRSAREERELRQKHVDEIYAEWEKLQQKTPKSLRSVRKGLVDPEGEEMDLPPELDEGASRKRMRTPEEEERVKRYKQEKENEELKIRNAYLEGRLEELEKTREKLERENNRLKEFETKLVIWQTKVEEREREVDKYERTINELKEDAIHGSVKIKELEVTVEQTERRRIETEEKLTLQEEEIRNLYMENGNLRAAKEVPTQTPMVTFAEMLKKDNTKIPEKTKLIESTKRNTKPTIMIKPKQGESLKDTRMRITKSIQRQDKINFQMIQTKTAILLQMATTLDEEKLLNHPNMKQNFDMTNRSEKRNPMMIIYSIPTEMKEAEVVEELLVRNLQDITDEQRQLIKPRFKTGPRGQDRYHLVIEVPRQVRQILIQNPKIYIGYEVTNIKDYLVVTTCLKCFDYGHIANHCKNDSRCGNCGDKSHKKNDCKEKEKKVCVPCFSRGKKCGGKQNECPQYKLSLQRTIDRFDYGS